MVLTNYEQSELKSAILLDLLADFLYGAVGSGSATLIASGTSLTKEVLRIVRQEYVQMVSDIVFSMYVNAGQANSTAIYETGWFTSVSGGIARQLGNIPQLNKTSDKELWVDTKISVSLSQS